MQEVRYIVATYKCPLCERSNCVELLHVEGANTESGFICSNLMCYKQHHLVYSIVTNKNDIPDLKLKDFLINKTSYACQMKNLGWKTEQNSRARYQQKMTDKKFY